MHAWARSIFYAQYKGAGFDRTFKDEFGLPLKQGLHWTGREEIKFSRYLLVKIPNAKETRKQIVGTNG
jgi:hypothetical protein